MESLLDFGGGGLDGLSDASMEGSLASRLALASHLPVLSSGGGGASSSVDDTSGWHAADEIVGGGGGGGMEGGDGGGGGDYVGGGEGEEVEQGGYYDEQVLPPHACAYCGVHAPTSVVRCVATGKWFCNSTGPAHPPPPPQLNGDAPPPPNPSRAGSHIVQHLVRSKHKEVAMHPGSPMGDTVLECYNCGTRNAFLLGFIPSKTDNMVVLLCREPCLTLGALKDQGWDLAIWEPLLQDRAFLPWLVPPPSEREIARARPVTPAAIASLETLWRTRPEASYGDLLRAEADGTGPEEDVAPVLLKYEDGYHYQNVFGPLVKMEADEDKAVKDAMRATGVSVRWARGLNRKWTARFLFHRGPDSELKLVPGDEMSIRLPSFASQFRELDSLVSASRNGASAEDDEGAWSGVGHVREVHDGEVLLEMGATNGDITDRMPTSGYTVEIVWRSVTFDRMQAALKKFAVDDTSVTGYLYHALLGHAVEPQILKATLPTTYSAPGLPELNPSQMAAVRTVLLRPLSLIQGPPGTGKTVTSATVVYHLSKQGTGQVLVAAPSNVAVDHLTEKIAATGLKVVRIAARSREAVASSVEHLCLHSMILALGGGKSELRKLHALKQEMGELSTKDGARYKRLQRDAEREVLAAADIICVTCAGAGDSRLSGMRFRQVLIDEATQAAEPECLIAIVQGCKQLVLVGDHCQLGPVITAKLAANAGLNQSLFERLILLGIRPIRLAVQYRMHPALSEFPSNTFYEGALQNGVTLAERTPAAHHEALGWPVPGRPMYFYICTGAEEMSGSGTSYLNRGEAQAVERIVTHIIKAGVAPATIGVITPYEGQRAYTTSYMLQNGSLRSSVYSEIEIASVDSFQGREKDYIVLSCVRSNDHAGIGFLSDPRRLNVALTRARYGVFIVGNPRVLAKQPLWHLLLTHFKGYGCLVEGPLAALKESHMHLPQPRAQFVQRALLLPTFGGEGGEGGVEGGAAPPWTGAEDGTIGPGYGNLPLPNEAASLGLHPMAFLGLGMGGLSAHWPALQQAAVAASAAAAATAAAAAAAAPAGAGSGSGGRAGGRAVGGAGSGEAKKGEAKKGGGGGGKKGGGRAVAGEEGGGGDDAGSVGGTSVGGSTILGAGGGRARPSPLAASAAASASSVAPAS